MSESEWTTRLARSMPRLIVAEERAAPLATWLGRSREAAIAEGLPGFARIPARADLLRMLSDFRRARRLVRGLEASESTLDAMAAGLKRSPASQVPDGEARISRIVLVSSDGAPRLYRRVESLVERHEGRVLALVLDTDENALGAAAYGQGELARILLINHKESVIDWLGFIDHAFAGGPAELGA